MTIKQQEENQCKSSEKNVRSEIALQTKAKRPHLQSARAQGHGTGGRCCRHFNEAQVAIQEVHEASLADDAAA